MIRCVGDLSKEIAEKYRPSNLAGTGYNFLGMPIEVKSNSLKLLSLLDRIYASFRSDGDRDSATVLYLIREKRKRDIWFLNVDPGFKSFICSDESQALSFCGAQLMLNHIYHSHFLFLHGSVLGRAGKIFIFLGGSRAGKTVLSLKLGRRGFTFFSDEAAALNVESGLIHPFPRSLLIRPDCLELASIGLSGANSTPFFYDYQEISRGDNRLSKRFIVPPEEIFPEMGKEPAEVKAIFFLEGFSDRETEILPLPAALALKMILDHGINPGYLNSENQEKALSILPSILKNAPAFTLRPGALEEEPQFLGRVISRAQRRGRVRGASDLRKVARRCREIMENGKM
jgi:hypothetical protein